MNAVAVPQHLRSDWEEILACEARIGEALETGELAVLEPLATRRHARILGFFERLALEPDSAAQRLELLRYLIERNEDLLEDSRRRLSEVVDAGARARLGHRALRAYTDG